MSTTPTAAKTARARWRRGLGVAGLATAAVGAALMARGGPHGFPGGTELVYTTDLDLAVDDRLRQVTAERADSFAVAPWQGDATTTWDSRRGYLIVWLFAPRRRDEALREISARAGGALALQACPPDEPATAVCLRVPAAAREQLRRSLLDEAGEKVRARRTGARTTSTAPRS